MRAIRLSAVHLQRSSSITFAFSLHAENLRGGFPVGVLLGEITCVYAHKQGAANQRLEFSEGENNGQDYKKRAQHFGGPSLMESLGSPSRSFDILSASYQT